MSRLVLVRSRQRQSIWWRAIALLWLLGAVACSPEESNGPGTTVGAETMKRPSVLLLTLDTTRADHLEPYGAENVATPALARLAAQGIVIENAVATSPVTAPSHASMLTGLYPPRHGVRNNSTHYLPEEIPTLAERLSEGGYQTAAFVSTVILERRYGLDQGFEVYDDEIRSSAPGDERRLTVERPAGPTTDRAMAWLDRLGKSEPYFLWVHYYDPHIPYSPPSEWAERYPGRGYDGEIAYMDSQINRLLQHPRVAADNVIVVAIGDHGESLGEHGEKTHGLLAYDSTLRVPWIIRIPGGPTGARVAAPVSQVDLMPTIVELAGLDHEHKVEILDGRSLLPLLQGREQLSKRLLFAETEVPFFAYGWSRLRTVRQGAIKLIAAPVPELYNLEHDPKELANLAAERNADVQRLTAEIEAWAARGDSTDSTMSIDTETAEMLHALGYFAGEPGRPEGEGRGNPVELMPVHQELQTAGELLASDRPEEALRHVQAALATDPENLAALRDLARGLSQLGRLDEAAAAAARASAVAPWSAQAAMVEADVEHQRGHSQRALELIEHALELDERFLEARLERSRYLAAIGRTKEAAAELESLLEESPDSSWVALRYAEIVEMPSGELEAAEQRLRSVVSRNPRFTEAWLLLGTVLQRAGQPSAAIEVYREGVASGAAGSELAARIALLLAEASDPRAETALREAILTSAVIRADLHLALAERLAARGNRQESQRQLELAAAAPASSAVTANAKATALMRLGRVDEAEGLWKGLTRERPGFWRAWVNLASLSIQRQDWAAAERFARAAIDREPTAATAWNNLAIALEELGRTSEAEATYRKASEIDPKDWRALFNLGILLRTGARYEEAAAVQQQVLTRNPRHSGAHFELGVLYAGPLGNIERAREHLQATISADPDHPRARQAQAVLERLEQLR